MSLGPCISIPEERVTVSPVLSAYNPSSKLNPPTPSLDCWNITRINGLILNRLTSNSRGKKAKKDGVMNRRRSKHADKLRADAGCWSSREQMQVGVHVSRCRLELTWADAGWSSREQMQVGAHVSRCRLELTWTAAGWVPRGRLQGWSSRESSSEQLQVEADVGGCRVGAHVSSCRLELTWAAAGWSSRGRLQGWGSREQLQVELTWAAAGWSSHGQLQVGAHVEAAGLELTFSATDNGAHNFSGR
jgi:hypothetical protein